MVTSAAGDWSLDFATYPMSMMIAGGGIAAAILGSVAGKIGIRKSMAMGSVLYGSGFGLAAAGVATHNLPLLYAGNLVCGAGYGLTYTPPIQVRPIFLPNSITFINPGSHRLVPRSKRSCQWSCHCWFRIRLEESIRSCENPRSSFCQGLFSSPR